MGRTIKDLPNDIIRCVYEYIGDITTECGLIKILNSSSFCREWRYVINVDDAKRSYVADILVNQLPIIIDGITKLEEMTPVYENTIIAINTTRPVVSMLNLQETRKIASRTANTCTYLSRILKNNLVFNTSTDSLTISKYMDSFRVSCLNSYMHAGLASFKTQYTPKIVQYYHEIENQARNFSPYY